MKTIIQRAMMVAALAALLGLLGGCGKSVKDVCDDLDDRCQDFGYYQCVDEGEALQTTADARECADTFSDYLDCTATAGCDWANQCAAQKQALEACTGTFPR